MMTPRPLLVLALLALRPLPASAGEGDGVRVELTGAATPFDRVVMEISERRGACLALVAKSFAAGFGRQEKVGLLLPEDHARLLDRLRALGAFELPSTRGPARRAEYTVAIFQGGRRHRFVVHDPAQQADARFRRILAEVRETAVRHAGDVPFRDALLLADESGVLRIKAQPEAHVEVDGVALVEPTPIDGLPLPVGTHHVSLVPLEATSDDAGRAYTIKIERGKTTTLNVELR